MAKYVLAYHGGGEMPKTEEAQAGVYEAWNAWFGSLGESVADVGNPIGQTKTIASDRSMTDGGGANPITGYSLITAESVDEAVTKAKGCPALAIGGSVEVAEAIDM